MIRISGDGTQYYQEVFMSSPQNELRSLADAVKSLTDMFKGDYNDDDDEDSGDIMFKIARLERIMEGIMNAQNRQVDLMNLIIKLLSKDG